MLNTRHREDILLRACLDSKQPFVIDNTNVTREDRVKYINAAKDAGFNVIGYYFQSKLQESLDRNSKRSGKALIPVKGILATHRKLQLPNYAEGFDQLFYVSINDAGEFIVTEWSDEI